MATWLVQPDQVLTSDEIDRVLADLTRRERRSPSAARQRIVFRLATFAGLRASEIAGLSLANLRLGERPSIAVPASIAKGGKARTVPLWSDATARELEAWRERRQATGSERVVVGQTGKPVDRHQVRRLFRQACKCLGPDRLAGLTVHHGRHTFVSMALARGIPVPAVRDAAGHANLGTTSIYAHVY